MVRQLTVDSPICPHSRVAPSRTNLSRALSYPTRLEPRRGPLQEARGGFRLLVRQHLGAGNSRAVIDAYVQQLPADPSSPSSSVAVDAVPDALDPAQLIRVQVQQFARMLLLVAHHHRLRLQVFQPSQCPGRLNHRLFVETDTLSSPATWTPVSGPRFSCSTRFTHFHTIRGLTSMQRLTTAIAHPASSTHSISRARPAALIWHSHACSPGIVHRTGWCPDNFSLFDAPHSEQPLWHLRQVEEDGYRSCLGTGHPDPAERPPSLEGREESGPALQSRWNLKVQGFTGPYGQRIRGKSASRDEIYLNP